MWRLQTASATTVAESPIPMEIPVNALDPSLMMKYRNAAERPRNCPAIAKPVTARTDLPRGTTVV
jgi:hypothetical protein